MGDAGELLEAWEARVGGEEQKEKGKQQEQQEKKVEVVVDTHKMMVVAPG